MTVRTGKDLIRYLERTTRRHRCPDCGAFCKPLWLPPPSFGTDPNWRCNNCGSRT